MDALQQVFSRGLWITLGCNLLVSVLAYGVMRTYASRIRRENRLVADVPVDDPRLDEGCGSILADKVSPLEFQIEKPSAMRLSMPFRSPAFRQADRAFRRAASVYAFGGSLHVAASVVLLFLYGILSLPLTPSRLSTWVWHAAVFWSWFSFTIVALALLFGPARRLRTLLVLGYVATLLAMGVLLEVAAVPHLPLLDVGRTPDDRAPMLLAFQLARAVSGKQISQEAVTIGPFLQPVIFWSLGGTPILMAALAFNRFVRGTVGPMFLTAALSVLLSSFVTFDLLVVAGPSRPLVGRLNRELGTPSTLAVVWSLSLFAACIAAWLGLRWVVRRYRRQQMSDQMFLLDALWLSLSAFVCVLLMYEQKPFRYLLGLLPFVLYKAAVGYGLSSLWKRASQMPGARLLFLRVFGSSGRAEKLFDLLAARWRYAGTIQLISGTDVARGRFEPDEFFDFVSGKLGDAFITSEADLEKRLASLNTRPDPDGRFRVNEFFCRADTWQLTVTRLMTVSDVLIMDLRAFTPERRGCVFELGAILDTVPLSRAVLLVDRTTDQPALRATLTSLWKRVKPHSPNVRGSARVRIVDLAGGYPAAVRYLMRLGDELALAAT